MERAEALPEARRRHWERQQCELAGRVIAYDDVDWLAGPGGWQSGLRLIAGLDISFPPEGASGGAGGSTSAGEAPQPAAAGPSPGSSSSSMVAGNGPAGTAAACPVAALAVLDFPALRLCHLELLPLVGPHALRAPYEPGFLGFREVPTFLELLRRAANKGVHPQLLLVDGFGVLHPRRCGSASHLGVLSGLPTVGVAKHLLHLDGLLTERQRLLWCHAAADTECPSPSGRLTCCHELNCSLKLLIGQRSTAGGRSEHLPMPSHPCFTPLAAARPDCFRYARRLEDGRLAFEAEGQEPCVPEQPRAASAMQRVLNVLETDPTARLHAAVASGDEASVAACIAAGGAVDRPVQGCSALFWACKLGHVPSARRLLAAGADPNWKASDSATMCSLHAAASGRSPGHSACTALLLAAGADACTTDRSLWLPLHTAAHHGNAATVQLLLAAAPHTVLAQHGGGLTSLHQAAFSGRTAAARVLLAAAPEVALMRAGTAGKTPFETACGWLHIDTARLLLEEAPLQPADEVLAALNKKGSWVLELYTCMAARLPLTAEQWALVPSPCPGLGTALPAVLQRSEAEAALLMARLPDAYQRRMHTFALCLAQAERRQQLPRLPAPLVSRLLALSVA
ncbi:endonuclease V family [Chlorella sorokiniana]|uniref:Endonuclease V family n=1 Tax=Chlorella sorokiniana TaxID=3076 RepID=A0A2P6TDB4_CHLSO|nr:endonuclease V family [Chlorella sorokiniana]|eukprot:PRW20634.1 endonuclease V family [Chlorella sorokiniana]